VEEILKTLKHLDEEKATTLEDILPLIQMGLEESRRIQMKLRPALLDQLGILATISWYCREFQKAHSGIHIETKITLQEDEIPGGLKTVLYRVMQEALSNISKHSKGNLVNLSLEKKEGTIEFIIQDNGQGFDSDVALSLKGSKSGLGLVSMKERTHLSGGIFAIESVKGVGTTIHASWPVS
jgi:signal transduction histidine kinase